jgi:hypothetical protein
MADQSNAGDVRAPQFYFFCTSRAFIYPRTVAQQGGLVFNIQIPDHIIPVTLMTFVSARAQANPLFKNKVLRGRGYGLESRLRVDIP